MTELQVSSALLQTKASQVMRPTCENQQLLSKPQQATSPGVSHDMASTSAMHILH